MNYLGKLAFQCEFATLRGLVMEMPSRPHRRATARFPLLVVSRWDAGGAVGEVAKVKAVDSDLRPWGQAEVISRSALIPITMSEAQRMALDLQL